MIGNHQNTDVLFWANIKPNKRGSFEDFMLLLSEKACLQNVNIKFVFGEGLDEAYQDKGMDFISADVTKLCSPLLLYRVVKETRPRCIHFHFISFVNMLPWLSKRLGVRSVLYTDHNSCSPSMLKSDLISRLKFERRKLYFRNIDYVIGVSDFVAGRYQPYPLFSEARVRRIYNGVDLKRFSPPSNDKVKASYKKNMLNLHNSETVITYCGQFVPEKGILCYADAVEALLTTCQNLCFAFVGAGPLYSVIHRIFEVNDPSKVLFLGFRNDFENILRASDILVIPSTWEEAFGLVAAEASACCVPVVGSDVGGIPEVVLDGITGILVPPGNVETMVNALQRLVGDPILRLKMGSAGRKHADKLFRMEDRVAQLLELYRSCLG
jgi:glycosyltransferase involved in cell wall biosynthesis